MISFILGIGVGLVIGIVGSFFVAKNNQKRMQELFAKADAYNSELDDRIKALSGLLDQIVKLLAK